ncbi:DUF3311 domain-containing protein [Lapillicoccus jejuensis]|uniref:Uncharacterized protein DUF3311 n=1 Tax=Lapillicoccus jejuensis TaxID=402171 RepID=A0A542E3X1_9MICO|nr:DUF3311 domain-containing protein [Lapillicoccus jejuensis]TQJ10015.1 uncharacterized protein DUF3311 [Lapillicoccus jejuensis]
MSTPAAPGERPGDRPGRYDAPPANRGLLAVATVLLALPIIALLLVSTYAKKEPTLGGVPFFIWYQFLWVFLCSAFTYAAYRLVLVARPHRPMTDDGSAFVEGDGTDARTEGTR